MALMLALLGRDADPASARLAGADYALASPPASGAAVDLMPLGSQASRPAIFISDDGADAAALERAAQGGAVAIFSAGSARILDRRSIGHLAGLAAAARDAKTAFGFSGALEVPDVPRLLALEPDLLGFDLDSEAGTADAALFARLCHGEAGTAGSSQTDRLFIRDFDLALPIGAYRSERGRTQTVRFSVEAEVRRPVPTATMADVYSYDLLMDAVGIATAHGHTDFVETLAEEVARLVLLDPRVSAVSVRVEKLELGPRAAGIEIRRQRA